MESLASLKFCGILKAMDTEDMDLVHEEDVELALGECVVALDREDEKQPKFSYERRGPSSPMSKKLRLL